MLTTGILLLEGSLLSPNPGLIFWTAVTFLLLLVLLSKLAWKPILTALEEREKNIQAAIDKANSAKDDAEKLLSQNKDAMNKAEAEAGRIIKEGKAYAEKMRDDIIAKAQADAKKISAQAKAEIEQEKQQALNMLREEVATLAVKGAEKIIRMNLDAEKHKAVVEGMLEDLSSKRN